LVAKRIEIISKLVVVQSGPPVQKDERIPFSAFYDEKTSVSNVYILAV
jgi:hypothetical protein